MDTVHSPSLSAAILGNGAMGVVFIVLLTWSMLKKVPDAQIKSAVSGAMAVYFFGTVGVRLRPQDDQILYYGLVAVVILAYALLIRSVSQSPKVK